MRKRVKSFIKKLPGMRKLVKKNELLEKELNEIRYTSVLNAKEAIDYRLQIKELKHEKINVVFVCHRPAVWESLHSVYDALKKDEKFNVSIVAIPNKKELPKLWLNHEKYESEGAETFWQEYGCIDGYNYETGEWYDIKRLKPDYVFFQQPYNIARCEAYKSWNVAQYAKICYLNYFSPVGFSEFYDECTPADFLRDISFYFTQNPRDHEYILNRYKSLGYNSTKCIMSGYPRYDRLNQINKNSDIWNDKSHSKYRIVWTPRWTTNEGNCHFFDYKDELVNFCLAKDIELVFRPHPQAFLEWNTTGEFTERQQECLRKQYKDSKNLHLDESSEYLSIFYSSDCLISDPSSVVYDYFLTGKPIIFCGGSKENDDFELLKGGLYETKDWNMVRNVLEKLVSGRDELKEKRKEVTKTAYYFNEMGAGNYIKEILKTSGKGEV